MDSNPYFGWIILQEFNFCCTSSDISGTKWKLETAVTVSTKWKLETAATVSTKRKLETAATVSTKWKLEPAATVSTTP